VDKNKSRIKQNWMTLNDEKETENSFHPRLVKQNCRWGSGWCGSRSFNVQFNINLDTSATAGRG